MSDGLGYDSVQDASQHRALIEELKRNTAAIRSIAVLLVSWIPWVLISIVPFFIGVVSAPYNSAGGAIGIGIGAALIIIGSVTSIVGALGELKKSK